MKKGILVFVLLNCFTIRAQQTFDVVIDNNNQSEGAVYVDETYDGEYTIYGGFINDAHWTQGVFMLGLNKVGEVQRYKAYIDTIDKVYYIGGYALAMSRTEDGYIAGGALESEEFPFNDIYASRPMLTKYDEKGDTLWMQLYGEWNTRSGTNFTKVLDDGSYIMGGTMRNDPNVSASKDILLIKTDTAGNVLMEQSYGGGKADEVLSLAFTPDGGYLLGGGTRSYGAQGMDTYLLKLDSLGNEVWDTLWGTQYDDCKATLIALKNGGYGMISCDGQDIFWDDFYFYASKLDENLQEVWRYDFSLDNPTTLISNMVELKDGSFIISGSKIDADLSQYVAVLYLLSADGELIWQRDYYANLLSWNTFYDVKPTSDGGFIAAGMAPDHEAVDNSQQANIWVIKTDCEGNLEWSNACNPIGMEEDAPPQWEYLSVRQGGGLLEVGVGWLPGGGSGRLLLYDAAGRLLWEQATAGQAAHSLNLGGMAAGMYFVRLVSEQGEGLQTKKVLVR